MLDHLLEPDYEPDYECFECNQHLDVIDDSKMCLESIVKMLYSEKEIDVTRLAGHIEKLCDHLDVELPNEYKIKKSAIRFIYIAD